MNTLKEIARIEDDFLVLNQELLELGKYLKETTLCNLITAYQTMLPSALKVKKQKCNYNKYECFVSLNKDDKYILEYISTHRGKKVEILNKVLSEKEINKKEFDSASVRELEKLGLVKINYQKVFRINRTKGNVENKTLNEEQSFVFEKVKKSFNKNDIFLLFGVTGSGKTLVYIHERMKVKKANNVLV